MLCFPDAISSQLARKTATHQENDEDEIDEITVSDGEEDDDEDDDCSEDDCSEEEDDEEDDDDDMVGAGGKKTRVKRGKQKQTSRKLWSKQVSHSFQFHGKRLCRTLSDRSSFDTGFMEKQHAIFASAVNLSGVDQTRQFSSYLSCSEKSRCVSN